MTIELYNVSDVSNKIIKNIGSPAVTVSGSLKDDCELLNPVIRIERSGVPNYNYAHIPEFSRYYFVDPPKAVHNNIWELKMHVDVLYTYRGGILIAPCIVAKSSSHYNLYLNDPNYKSYSNPQIFSERFPSGFNVENAHFVMTIFGGKVRAE